MKFVLFFYMIACSFICIATPDKEKDKKNTDIPITHDDVQAVKQMQQKLSVMLNITSGYENVPLVGPILAIDSSDLKKLPYL